MFYLYNCKGSTAPHFDHKENFFIMAYTVETTVYFFSGNIETPVFVIGNVEPGQDAATGQQGLPTECATSPEVYATLVVVAGNEIITDADEKRAAEMFGLTVAELIERINEELIEALDDVPAFDDGDDLIF